MERHLIDPRSTSPGNRAYIIAEMASSHEGDLSLAHKIIDAAGRAEADAIQFQVWKLADLVVPHHPEYAKLKKIELSRQGWTNLANYVKNNYPKTDIIACVYEKRSVDFCETIQVDAYKIHSADLSNPSLIRYVAETGKRVDLSAGASTLDEIQAAIHCIRSVSNSEIWLMYGYQNFPTPPDEVHLSYIAKLSQLFELQVGYQDHTDAETEGAFWLPAAALGMGVRILEKHLTHDRSLKGIDHEAALNPDEFSRFVQMIRMIEAAMGSSTPRPFSEEELKYRKYAKKSLVAARDLPADRRVSEDDLLAMRADTLGLPPDKAQLLIGRSVKRPIPAYHLILEDDVV